VFNITRLKDFIKDEKYHKECQNKINRINKIKQFNIDTLSQKIAKFLCNQDKYENSIK